MTQVLELKVGDDPADEDIRFLEEEIYRYNVERTGIDDGRLLSIIVADEQGRAAGLYGWTWGGVLDIREVWVRNYLRRRGMGTRLLAAAEVEAVRRGCSQAILETHEFQAPGFYAEMGYRVFAEAQDYPRGHSKLYLRKTLTSQPPT